MQANPWGAAINAAAGVATAAVSGANTSGAQVDARSWMDGSGWTVATGRSEARGGRFGSNTQEGGQTGAPPGGGSSPAPMPMGIPPSMVYADGGQVGGQFGLFGGGGMLLPLLLVGAAFLFARR